jgi:phosphatidylglycerophosphate synthase
MTKEKIFNVPNALSFYRILVFPLILIFLITGNERMFAIFLCINLITDFLDGIIARTFHLVTNLGARLDSLGDIGTYILAFTGIFRFKTADLAQHGWILYIFTFMYIMDMIIHFYRFHIFSSFHLYSFKTTGYLHGILFFLWFFVGFFPGYYYFSMGFGILAESEALIIMMILNERRSNVKGLYWILKEKNE